MDVSAYLDRARAVAALESDYALARALGVTKQYVSDLRKRRALPGDETMHRLATLAGEDVELALLRLNYWKARHGEAKATYRRMIERLGATAAAVFIGVAAIGTPAPSRAAFSDNPQAVYYGNKWVVSRSRRSSLSNHVTDRQPSHHTPARRPADSAFSSFRSPGWPPYA